MIYYVYDTLVDRKVNAMDLAVKYKNCHDLSLSSDIRFMLCEHGSIYLVDSKWSFFILPQNRFEAIPEL